MSAKPAQELDAALKRFTGSGEQTGRDAFFLGHVFDIIVKPSLGTLKSGLVLHPVVGAEASLQ